MADAKRILELIEDTNVREDEYPAMLQWSRGFNAGLKVAAQIVRTEHLNSLARAGNLADLADAETAYGEWTEAERMYERG